MKPRPKSASFSLLAKCRQMSHPSRQPTHNSRASRHVSSSCISAESHEPKLPRPTNGQPSPSLRRSHQLVPRLRHIGHHARATKPPRVAPRRNTKATRPTSLPDAPGVSVHVPHAHQKQQMASCHVSHLIRKKCHFSTTPNARFLPILHYK